MNIIGHPTTCLKLSVQLALVMTVTMAHAQGRSQNANHHANPAQIQNFDLDKTNANYQVVERGPNHRVWQKAEITRQDDGTEKEVLHAYTELGSGLHYWDEDSGRWEDSRAVIEPYQGGAVARFGQQKVIFSNNLNTLGSIDILAPDGVRLKASVLGLGYYDSLSGKSVILAELKNSIGELIGENQILYKDAFDGVEADVLYTYSLNGLEQDVILRENPPAPSEYGLPNLTSRLEVMTEWYDTPDPQKSTSIIRRKVEDPNLRSQMVEPDLVDEKLDFGELKIGRGKAFWQNQTEEGSIRFEALVGKKWETIDDRTFLFEAVDYEAIEAELQKLPQGRKKTAMRSQRTNLTMVSLDDVKRKVPKGQFADRTDSVIQPSKNGLSDNLGFVLDYSTFSGTYYNVTFYGGQTYYLSNTCVFNGTTTFQGGSVIKYASGSSNSAWFQSGTVDFQTSLYMPVVFTARDDNSVGDYISGSTGSPYSYYGYSQLRFNYDLPPVEVKNVIMRYASRAIIFGNGENNLVRNGSFLHGSKAICSEGGSVVTLENVLIDDFADAALYSDSTSSFVGAHLTVHDTNRLGDTTGTSLSLVNSLIVAVPTIYAYTNRGQSYNVELTNYADAFQTVGAGAFYLKSSSPYRDFSGAATIDSGLHDELKERTTYPPGSVYISSSINSNTTWDLTAQRDTDALDLGYHYPPMDVAVSYLSIMGSGTTLTINPGVVVGVAGQYGLWLDQNTSINIDGHPFMPALFTYYRTAQEQTTYWGSGGSSSYFIIPKYNPGNCENGPDVQVKFTQFNGCLVYACGLYGTQHFGDISVEHSVFNNASISMYGHCSAQNYRNNLFNRSSLYFSSSCNSTEFNFHNNTSINGGWSGYFGYSGPVPNITDNVFDHTSMNHSFSLGVNHSNNGYISVSNPLPNLDVSNVVISGNYSWQQGPMGDYYHSTGSSFLDAGSLPGWYAGLYHFTTLVDQTPEEGGTLDLGYHYPALDLSGNLLDFDNDQIPNLFEDLNGNGMFDPGETDWGGGSGGGGGSGTPDLEVFTILK